MLVHANRLPNDREVPAGISNGTCNRILSDDLNVSHVTQHSVPHVLTQDQCEDSISVCSGLIDSADKDGTFLNWT
jgi:hypothetical protein